MRFMKQAIKQYGLRLSLRTYAPVGAHEDLLPYLVRRLLENGANTSFVHLLLNDRVPPDEAVRDPLTLLEAAGTGPHPRIPLPRDLYGDRRNSEGLDLSIAAERAVLVKAERRGQAACGAFADAGQKQIDAAFVAAGKAAQPARDGNARGAGRATSLRAMADALEQNRIGLMTLAVQEAGKTWPDAIGEVREAADFCRYYALLAERHFSQAEILKGPAGETNALELHGRGVFACISPWNFPLAIFTGQIAAALAAGNCVVAKPAEQTPRIAAAAVKLFYEAGLPADVLHLLPGGRSKRRRRRLDRDISGSRRRRSPSPAAPIRRRLINRSLAAHAPARCCPSSPRPAG